MNKQILYIFISIFIFSCGSDDEGASNANNFGDFQLSLNGDLSGSKNGFADFASMDSFGIQTWEISLNDNNPQTLSLQFMLSSATGNINRPEPGTYEIGFSANSDSVFLANYVNIPDGNFQDSEEYSTFVETYGGTLTIEASTDNIVAGSFEFTAAKEDDNFNVIGSIEVEGTFSATARQN